MSLSHDGVRPLVTILITARNRPEELAMTLRKLREQTYTPIDLLVVDDCSDSPLEQVVRVEWPDATVVRNTKVCGLIASRSYGMKVSRGEYIVSLDDDSCLTDPHDLSRAVSRLQASAKIGILTFLIHNGAAFENPPEAVAERNVHTFVGCGHLIRKAVIDQVGGYRDFYFYYGEEHEYALRAMDAGWQILFFPAVAVHHRVSSVGRNPGRIGGYSLRNNIWTAILLLPARRIPLEVGWKLGVGVFEAARLCQFKWLLWAVGSTIAGLPRALRLRSPVETATASRYDYLRFNSSGDGFPDAHLLVTWSQRWRWLVHSWANRRRARSFWDRKDGGIGDSPLAQFSNTDDSDDRRS
jgi:GT2 family glycosyltransferase